MYGCGHEVERIKKEDLNPYIHYGGGGNFIGGEMTESPALIPAEEVALSGSGGLILDFRL